MKMVKTLMAVALVFALVIPALADDICPPCQKCPPRSITCPTGDQYGAYCYNGDEYYVEGVDGSGNIYTGTSYYATCPVIFDICECDDVSLFIPGAEIAVRMKLLVNGQEGANGAYFAEHHNGWTVMSCNRQFLCQPICDNTPSIAPGGPWGDGIDAWECDSAAYSVLPIQYRGHQFNDTNTTYYYWGTGGYTIGGVPSASACPVTGINRVTQFITDNDLVLAEVDEEYGMCNWAMDIPMVRVSPELDECSTISVQIDILTDAGGTICSESVAECSCVYDLYTVCCDTSYSNLLFPYFTNLSDSGTMWNGIVITNLSSSAGTATLTAYEQDGSIGTYTTPVIAANSMFVDLLENIPWTGTGLGGQRCYITVSADFSCDGFAMMSDYAQKGVSMGYLPRQTSQM